MTDNAPFARLAPRSEARPVDALPGIVRRTLVTGDKTMVVEFTLAKGSVIPPHSHPHEQCGVVIKGKVRFSSGETSMDLNAGDAYCFQGDNVHSAEALEDSLVVDIFSPVREEYR